MRPLAVIFLGLSLIALRSTDSLASEVLTLPDAIHRVYADSPQRAIERYRRRAHAGELLQASLYDNPSFSYSAENVFGNRSWKGWDSAESRYEFSQTIELCAKRTHRKRVAEADCHLSSADFALIQLEEAHLAVHRFFDSLLAQRQIEIAKEQLQLAETMKSCFNAGEGNEKTTRFEALRVEIEIEERKIELAEAQLRYRTSLRELALLWQGTAEGIDRVQHALLPLPPLPPIEALLNQIDSHPLIRQACLQEQRAHRLVELERVNGVPDVEVMVGYKNDRSEKNHGMTMGVSIPLPLFDRNQGNLRRARAELQQSQFTSSMRRDQLQIQLENLYATVQHNRLAAERTQERMLTLADESVELAHRGCSEGKFNLTRSLEEKQFRANLLKQNLSALVEYHRSLSDLYTLMQFNHE